MNVTTGYQLPKPVETQKQCDAYAAMAQVVNDHNAACKAGDTLWTIGDKSDEYVIVANGTAHNLSDAPSTLQ